MAKKRKPQSFKHSLMPNGVWETTATIHIPKGTRILCDNGLICLPSNLPPTTASKTYIEERVSNLPQDKQHLFFELSNFFESKYGQVFGRYHTHATVIRHTPHYSGIFPTLSKVRHSCAPNCVAAVLECRQDPRKDWVLALHAVRDIAEGEELTRFWIKGGGDRTIRINEHMRLFGTKCHCPVCSLTGTDLLGSDSRRRMMCRLHAEVALIADGKAETRPGRPGSLPLFITALSNMRYYCQIEGISDHSLWLMYGQAALLTFRFAIQPFAWLFCHELMELDRVFLGADNPIHRHEFLTQF